MNFYTKMDMIKIKEEDQQKMVVGVKQETVSWEITVDKHNVQLSNVKEEVESGCEDFEKVFLPETCNEVSMETPFFDHIQYKRKYEQIEEITPRVCITKENMNEQIDNCNQYKQMIQERYHNIRNTLYDLESDVYHYENNVSNQNNLGENSNNPNFNVISTCKYTNTLQALQGIGNRFIHNHSTFKGVNKSNMPNNCKTSQKRGYRDMDENCKYKCHLCKRFRGFYTLEAANNHLKFEHISVFNKSKLKGKNILIEDKNFII